MSEGRKLIKELKQHPLHYFLYYTAGLFIVVVSILASSWLNVLVGLLIMVFIDLIRRAHTYRIYDTGVERQFKFIMISKTFTDYSRIQDLSVERSLIDRIFGLGKVKINTAGSPGIEVSFVGIQNPEEIEEMVRGRLRK